jgi:ubiquitin C
MKATDTILDVKREIASQVGIPAEQQKLSVDDWRLKDHKVLSSYKVKKDSPIFVNVELCISVSIPSGETFALQVETSETINDIISKIKETKNIIAHKLSLTFGDQQLEGPQSVCHYKNLIEDKPVLQLHIEMLISVDISSIYGILDTSCILEVDISDSVECFKSMIHATEGIPPDQQRITIDNIQLENGHTLSDYNLKNYSTLTILSFATIGVQISLDKTVTVDLGTSDTIGSIKSKIDQLEGIPATQQVLKFNDQQLEDSKTLSDCDIMSGSTLVLNPCLGMRIFVETDTEYSLNLVVEPSNTIRKLKALIQESEGVPSYQQTLTFRGKQLKDNQTLSHCGIQRKSVLLLNSSIRISLKTPFDKTLTLDVDGSYSISNVKARIKNMVGFPLDQQRLILDGTVRLEDDCTLWHYKIEEQSNLNIELSISGGMKIFVQTISGEVIAVEVKASDTVKTVKAEIQKKRASLQLPDQLTFIFHGTHLKDHFILSSCGIHRESILHLEMTIFVKIISIGEVVPLKVSTSDNFKDIKSKIEDLLGIPTDKQSLLPKVPDDTCTLPECGAQMYWTLTLSLPSVVGMHIFVKTPTGKSIFLQIETSDTVRDIKFMIQNKERTPLGQQMLYSSNRLLDDSHTVFHYNISTIHLIIHPPGGMGVHVKTPFHESLTLGAMGSDTIAMVKSKILNLEGIPTDQQKVKLSGKELADDRTLSDCNVQEGSVLHIELSIRGKMKIFVQSEKIHALEVHASDTIKQVKDKYQDILPHQQILTFRGAQLEDDTNLSSCSVHRESILQLALKVFVKIANIGGAISLQVSISDTIRGIKSKIEDLLGIPIDRQELLFAGEALVDTHTLSECGAQMYWTLTLSLPSVVGLHVFVKTPTGNSFFLGIETSDTVRDLKFRIEKKEGTPLGQQMLYYSNKLLDDSHTVSRSNIRNFSTIHLISCPPGGMCVGVKTPFHESSLTLGVMGSDTIAMLKSKILRLDGIPTDQQRVKLSGKELGVDCTLSDCNAQEGSVLHIELNIRGKMKIFVQSEKIHALEVHASHTIKQVKDKYQDILPHQQILTFHGAQLEDDTNLSSCCVHRESILQLAMKVFVKIASIGETISLQVSISDNIRGIKSKIEDLLGIPIDRQELLFASETLADTHTLSECGAQMYWTLTLSLPSVIGMHVFVKAPTGNSIFLEIETSDTVRDIKFMIQNKEGTPPGQQMLYSNNKLLDDSHTVSRCKIRNYSTIHLVSRPPGGMCVCVKTTFHESLTLGVMGSDTIAMVKSKILNLEGIPADQQKIKLFDQQKIKLSGKELADDRTLSDYNVQEGSVLHIEPSIRGKMKIFVQCEQIHALEVHASDTIKQVKNKNRDILPHQQILTFRGVQLEDNSTLHSCGIHRESILQLAMNILVDIADIDENIPLQLSTSSTIRAVKLKIEGSLGICSDHQRLFLASEVLADTRTLSECGGVLMPRLKLLLHSSGIFVKVFKGKMFFLEVETTCTVKDIKSMIRDKEETPLEQQMLYYSGQHLEDSDTVSHCKHSAIHLLPFPGGMRIFVNTPDCKLTLGVQYSDAIADIKFKIHHIKGISVEHQKLFFNDQLLDTNNTLLDYKIENDFVLLLHVKVQIIVKTPTGEILTLDVDSSCSVENIKSKVYTDSTPPHQQFLFYKDTYLENDCVLFDYIPKDYTLSLHCSAIFVQVFNDKKIILEIDESDVVIWDIMDRIDQLEGIPAGEQVLKFDGQELESRRILSGYNIKSGSTLMLDPCVSMRLFVETPTKESYKFIVVPSDTIADLKGFIQDRVGSPPYQQLLSLDGEQLEDDKTLSNYSVQRKCKLLLDSLAITISVKTPFNKTLTFDVNGYDKISNVKAVIKNLEHFPLDQQYLILDGKLLKDDDTLWQYKIEQQSNLSIKLRICGMMKIFVQTIKGEKISLEVKASDSVKTVKTKIQKKRVTLPDQLTFIFHGAQLEENEILSACNVHRDAIVHLAMNILVIIDDISGTISLQVSPSENIKAVKAKIQGYASLGITACQQTLFLAGKLLKDNCTLSECGVQNLEHYTLKLSLHSSKEKLIFVKIPSGKTIILEVGTSDTIEGIKFKIKDKEEIPREHQMLFFYGKHLDDRHTVSYYNIHNYSTVDLVSCLPSGMCVFVKTPFHESLVLGVVGSDTVASVKSKIWSMSSIPTDQQKIVFSGDELKDYHTLSEYNLQKEAVLQVEVHIHTRMMIFVRKHSGKSISVDVHASDTVKKLKSKIKCHHEETLTFFGKELEESQNLAHYNVYKESTLCLAMNVLVKTTAGQTISLWVNKSDSIKEVKCKIQDKINVPAYQQRLSLLGNDLEDCCSLYDYSIKRADTLDLCVRIHISVNNKFLSSPSGMETVELDDSDTIGNIKSKIYDKKGILQEQQILIFNSEELKDNHTLSHYGISDNNSVDLVIRQSIRISVEISTGKYIHLQVEVSDTIADIKYKTNLPLGQRALIHNDMQLKDSCTVRDYSIQEGDVLQYLDCPKPSAQEKIPYPNDINMKSTGEQVMPIIQSNQEDTPPNQQRLLFGDKELKHDHSLSRYNVRDGSSLVLELQPWNFFVFVETYSGERITLVEKTSENIQTVKHHIKEKLDIPTEEQELFFSGRQLKDKCTLFHYSIQKGSKINTLYVLRSRKSGEMAIIVKIQSVKTTLNVILEVKPAETIKEVKVKAKAKAEAKVKSLPTDQQLLLLLAGMEMEDSCTLSDYNIQNGDTLYLVFCYCEKVRMKMFVKATNGREFLLDVGVSETITDIKSRIQAQEGFRDMKLFAGKKFNNHHVHPVWHILEMLRDFLKNVLSTGKDKELKVDGTVQLKDGHTLSDYNVHEPTNIFVLLCPSPEPMIIFIKLLCSDEKFPLDAEPHDTIENIKYKIFVKEGYPTNQQRLCFNGKVLQGSHTLSLHGIQNDDVLELNTGPLPTTVATHHETTHEDFINNLPKKVLPYLEHQVDFDNNKIQKDLNEIANEMLQWEEKKLLTLDYLPEIYMTSRKNTLIQPCKGESSVVMCMHTHMLIVWFMVSNV